MRIVRALTTLAILTLLTGCGTDERPHTLTVLAASSLKEVFEQAEEDFERRHEDVDVQLVFGSSATLAEQVKQGAPGDVLVTADKRTMGVAQRAGVLHSRPEWFASNFLVVAVPATGAKVKSVADLDDAGTDYVTCVPTAPCGAPAGPLLRAAGVDRKPVSEETDVKATLARVLDGDADAAIVYRTDAVAEKDQIWWLKLPGAEEHPNTYWAASTDRAQDKALAAEWLGEIGDPDRLIKAGFLINPGSP